MLLTSTWLSLNMILVMRDGLGLASQIAFKKLLVKGDKVKMRLFKHAKAPLVQDCKESL